MKTIIKVLLFVAYIAIIFVLLNLWLLVFEDSPTIDFKRNIFMTVLMYVAVYYLLVKLWQQYLLKREARREYDRLVNHYRLEMLRQSFTGFTQQLVVDEYVDDLLTDIESMIKAEEDKKKDKKKGKKK